MPLRKRIRVLERASSLSSLADAKIIPEMKHHDSIDDIAPSSFTDYESHSDTSGSENDDEKGGEEDDLLEGLKKDEHSPRFRPTIETANVHRRHTHDESSPMSPRSRAWYEFDLAVVVALVSPVGNWLTGGDHVKNLLLIVLLIFYLHQIIESTASILVCYTAILTSLPLVPWMLYQSARRRESPRHTPPLDPAEARYAQLAASELRTFELFFLLLTFLSPFIGASLLRYATAAVLGPDAVSWFSTGLFVLATGMRPWAHLVDRLSGRTMELQEYVHRPSPTHVASEQQHLLLEKRVTQMEKYLSKIKPELAHTTDDVYKYIDDAVDTIEHAMRKQERKWDKYEGKVKEVEQVVVGLKSTGHVKENGLGASRSTDLGAIQTSILSMIGYIIPGWLIALPGHKLFSMIFSPSALFSADAAVSEPKRYSPSTPLETILEEESMSDSSTNYPLLARPYSLTSNIVHRTGYIVTLPLRAVVRMILRNY